MNRKTSLKILVTLSGLSVSIVAAHPYDSPLTFREHKLADGWIIFSNIPVKCFTDGVLICIRLHPVFPNFKPAEAADSRV